MPPKHLLFPDHLGLSPHSMVPSKGKPSAGAGTPTTMPADPHSYPPGSLRHHGTKVGGQVAMVS